MATSRESSHCWSHSFIGVCVTFQRAGPPVQSAPQVINKILMLLVIDKRRIKYLFMDRLYCSVVLKLTDKSLCLLSALLIPPPLLSLLALFILLSSLRLFFFFSFITSLLRAAAQASHQHQCVGSAGGSEWWAYTLYCACMCTCVFAHIIYAYIPPPFFNSLFLSLHNYNFSAACEICVQPSVYTSSFL